ncbi:hypothetical protein AN957_24670 [Cytobacillus solani]|uniref:Uncharacterized protein n=1 Tax=Cytobacillus solani TaxID=1637975 RepID=A0A0Q3TE86_9BACI|nr:hypothetical protein AN957_24670 [Cytobacillus solani]
MLESEGGSSSDKIQRKRQARVRSQFKFRQDSEKNARSSPKVVQVQTRSVEIGTLESEVSSSSDKIRRKRHAGVRRWFKFRQDLEKKTCWSPKVVQVQTRSEEKGTLESEVSSRSDKIRRKGHVGVRRWSKFRQDPKKKACWSPKSVQVQTRSEEKGMLESKVSSSSDKIRRKGHVGVRRWFKFRHDP